MSRNVLFASAIVALSGGLSLFADPKAGPDPVGPPDSPQAVLKTQAVGKGNQANQGPGTTAAGSQAAGQWQWKNADHAMASCVALGNQEEIALGELGGEKAQNDDVKKFAQMLVSDHQEFLSKLKQFAPEASAAGYLSSETRQAQKGDEAAPEKSNTVKQAAATDDAAAPAKVQPTAGTRPGMNEGMKHLMVERELAQQCLAGAKEKLEGKSGVEFDKCFIGQQIAMHMGMKAKLIVYQRHSSRELAQVLAAGQKKTEEHLAKAEELMKDLDHGSASTTTTIRKERTKEKDKASNKE